MGACVSVRGTHVSVRSARGICPQYSWHLSSVLVALVCSARVSVCGACVIRLQCTPPICHPVKCPWALRCVRCLE
eukprot:264456-Chlamydomonas_euryale.AAC.2